MALCLYQAVVGQQFSGLAPQRHSRDIVAAGMIELDQQTLRAVKVVSENDNHYALPCLRVGSHGNRWRLFPLPLASGNKGHGKQQSAGGCPAKGPPKPDPAPV